jgi:1-acyl-sn-glycerol-3-phosphate acyltransferase
MRGGVLLVSNHQSFLDPVLATMWLERESSYMARDSLFTRAGFRRLIESLNAFPVRRGTADVGAIKEGLRRLKQGMALVVFPEGTRTRDGQIGPMLPGLGAIAMKARVPVVPVLIDGAFQSWPRERKLPAPGDIIVEYGHPIVPAEYAGLSPEALSEEVRGRLIKLQAKWHRRVPGRRLEWFRDDLPIEDGAPKGTPGTG